MQNNKYLEAVSIGLLYLGYSLLVLCSVDDIFFWDTVQLGAKQGHFFYDTTFNSWLLPDEIDSGHIPIFGAYLASVWTIFGKSLMVSHLAMLPFVIGIVYNVVALSKVVFTKSFYIIAATILLAEPTITAQCSLISPDVILMFAFLGIVRHILIEKSNIVTIFFALILACISLRGMMMLFGLAVWQLYRWYQLNSGSQHKFYQWVKIYGLPAIVVMFYMVYHYAAKGWIGHHPDSPWAPSFEKASFYEMGKNIIVYGWRIVDFGKWPVVILAIFFFIKKSKVKTNFLPIVIIIGIIMAYSFIGYKGLQGHRYLLPLFLTMILYVLVYLQELNSSWKFALSIIIFASMITGHLWKYPSTISQGWDSSLAYKPYSTLWRQMFSYANSKNIPIHSIGSAFPNINSLRDLTLQNMDDYFVPLDTESNDYILTSNIYNDIKEDLSYQIKSRYTIEKVWQKDGIDLTLWKKKNN